MKWLLTSNGRDNGYTSKRKMVKMAFNLRCWKRLTGGRGSAHFEHVVRTYLHLEYPQGRPDRSLWLK